MCRCNSYKTLHQPGVQDDRWGTGSFFFLLLSSRWGGEWAPSGNREDPSACTCWLVVGGEERGPVLLLGGCLLASSLSFPRPGETSVCVYFWSGMDGQTGGQTQKMKGGLLGSSEMKCTAFPASGLGLSSQGTHSCGRRSNNVSPREGGPTKKERDREIYTLAVVFLHCVYGGTLARYLDTSTIFTHGNCNQPDEFSPAGLLWW